MLIYIRVFKLSIRHPLIAALFLCLLSSSLFSQDIVPRSKSTATDPLVQRAFSLAEVQLKGMNVPIEYILNRLPNREAWIQFFNIYGKCIVYIDNKSGKPVNIIHQFPLILEPGENNKVKFDRTSAHDNSAYLTKDVVINLFDRFVKDHSDVLALDLNQLGEHTAFQTNNDSWEVSISQQLNGIPVRDGRIGGTIFRSNLSTLGLIRWENVNISTEPKISPQRAYDIGFDYAGGRSSNDEIWKEAALEIIAIDTGGENYSHRLLWNFGFRRIPSVASWEVLVDAHTGQIIAFRDVNQY